MGGEGRSLPTLITVSGDSRGTQNGLGSGLSALPWRTLRTVKSGRYPSDHFPFLADLNGFPTSFAGLSRKCLGCLFHKSFMDGGDFVILEPSWFHPASPLNHSGHTMNTTEATQRSEGLFANFECHFRYRDYLKGGLGFKKDSKPENSQTFQAPTGGPDPTSPRG